MRVNTRYINSTRDTSSLSLISRTVSVDVKHHVYFTSSNIVQELCESRGGHPGLSVLTSLLVSMDVKLY